MCCFDVEPTNRKSKKYMLIPSAHLLYPRCPVSAMPTAFASQIGQFPPYDISPSIANRKSKKYVLHPVSAGTSTRPPCTYCGRADNACTNLLDFFVRYVRTRGMVKIAESAKLTTCTINLCRTYSPRMARATNSCTRREFFKREESPLK